MQDRAASVVSRFDAVIFDFDGLIVDTEWPAFITVQRAFEEHGATMTIEEWSGRIGQGEDQRRPWTELLEDKVGPIDHVAVAAKRRLPKDELTDEQPLLPGVVETLDWADNAALALAVASSSPSSWVEPHLEARGIHHRFRAIRTRDHVVSTKPAPDVFLSAAEALGVDPTRALVFEDSVNGVVAAKAAGMTAVAVPNRITASSNFAAADLVLESLLHFRAADLV